MRGEPPARERLQWSRRRAGGRPDLRRAVASHQGLCPQPRDRPGDTLLAIILVLGLWLFGAGVVEIIRGIVYPGQRLLALLTGAIDVIIAILILSWPKESLGTLAILTGIAFIIRGALMVYRGIQVRRLAVAG